MITTLQVESTFRCSLERAFKTPILGDATQFLVGYGPVPAVVKFTDDETCGQVGGTRIPHSGRSLVSKGGPIGVDHILARKENEYWNWGVLEFLQPSLGFTKFVGEMFFHDNGDGTIHVTWIYRLHSDSVIAYPFHWSLGKVFWLGQMNLGIQRMKAYAESDQEFLYQ